MVSPFRRVALRRCWSCSLVVRTVMWLCGRRSWCKAAGVAAPAELYAFSILTHVTSPFHGPLAFLVSALFQLCRLRPWPPWLERWLWRAVVAHLGICEVW